MEGILEVKGEATEASPSFTMGTSLVSISSRYFSRAIRWACPATPPCLASAAFLAFSALNRVRGHMVAEVKGKGEEVLDCYN